MYGIVHALGQIFLVLAVIFGIALVSDRFYRSRSKAQREELDKALRGVRSFLHSSEKEAAPAPSSFDYQGVPPVKAGSAMANVPTIDLAGGSATQDPTVLTVLKATLYLEDGKGREMHIRELSGGDILVSINGKVLLMKACGFSEKELFALQAQRQDAIDKNDGVIESFEGASWQILGAAGTNMDVDPGERSCSFIAVQDAHPDLGTKDGPVSAFPASLLTRGDDGGFPAFDYYDMQARNDATGELLLFLYVDGVRIAFIGRALDRGEIIPMWSAFA